MTAEKQCLQGIVEHFSRRGLRGWVSVPATHGPVRVDLYLNDLRVASTHASPASSPVRRVHRAAPVAATDPLPGPSNESRNSREQIRTFAFRVRGLWRYCDRRSRLTVRVGEQRLPIAGHGMFLNPHRGGKESFVALRALFDAGYVLSQMGDVQLSKQLDVEWQRAVMALYSRVRDVVAEHHGYDAFAIYGTLLGAVREQGYIGHDVDFDAAYMSSLREPRAAAGEFERIAMTLIKAGLEVDAKLSALHVHDPSEPRIKIDLFHLYFDADGKVRFPFGVAGHTEVTEDDWSGTHEIDFSEGKLAVPVNAEQLVAHIYGHDWREPRPGFDWSRDRTDQAVEALLTQEQRTEIYWANFYARARYATGSTFSKFVTGYPDVPSRIIDIGCGEGRDSCAFGASGKRVLGVDQSQLGIDQAKKHAADLGIADRTTFDICDVTDEKRLLDILTAFVEESPEPVVFYLRFFLHAISETAQETVLSAIASSARDGDYFAAEFRTDKDAKNTKVHQKHYRRFQSAETFRESLVRQHRFEVLHEEEGTGLSPYKEEDPVLYRVIARRGNMNDSHR
jgi:hypothetical protein